MHESIKFKEFSPQNHQKSKTNNEKWLLLVFITLQQLKQSCLGYMKPESTTNIANWYTEHCQYTEYFEVNGCYFENVLKTFSIKGFSPNRKQLCEKFSIQPQIRICINQYTLHCTALHYEARISKVFTSFVRIWFALFMRSFWCLSWKSQAKSETFSITNRENRQSMRKNVVVCVWMLQNGDLQT